VAEEDAALAPQPVEHQRQVRGAKAVCASGHDRRERDGVDQAEDRGCCSTANAGLRYM
jgi:hypothetical protein